MVNESLFAGVTAVTGVPGAEDVTAAARGADCPGHGEGGAGRRGPADTG
jgi:hypothetical protein